MLESRLKERVEVRALLIRQRQRSSKKRLQRGISQARRRR